MQYKGRAIDSVLTELLEAMGAVLIEGPRGCGKTSTALAKAASHVRLDKSPSMVQLAELNPSEIMKGDTPRLIDEWQLAPSIWNAVRHEIDDRQQRGQFILSGSSSPTMDESRHSGAGRIARLRMRPMALVESGASSGSISLNQLGMGESVSATSELSYKDLAEQAVRGGWPGLLEIGTRQAIAFNRSYCENICESELEAAVGVRHNPDAVQRLMSSVARNISSEATLQNMAKDIAPAGTSVEPKTVAAYIDALNQVFALEELPAWSVSLRSRSRLRTSSKLHLADPSLACATLGVGIDRLAGDPEYFGQVFESMVIRDLRTLASAEFGRVYHYRDNTGLEVDAIIEYPEDSKWAACEVKLGSSRIHEAEENLLKLANDRVDLEKIGKPTFLAVITGTEYAYTLPSGVHVVPLGVLGY